MFGNIYIYIWYRTKSSKRFRDILLEECDPDRALAMYTNLISYAKRQRNWELHFYNLANILYYAGRSDDVKKVQALLKKYCTTSLGNMYYEMIGAKLALYAMNREALQKHCSNMAELIKNVRLKGMMKFVYYEIMQYPALVQMWDNGEYVKLYNELMQAKFLKKTLSSKVKQNYYLYKVSFALNDKEKMDKHRAFVIQNGKGLWYCKELKKEIQ